MTFTKTDKLKAIAIVNIFETSRPFGDYAACVVLNDGAGISYGISQFTHRSGSLAAVAERYLKTGGMVGAALINENLAALRDTRPASIARLSANEPLIRALRAAAVTREMKAAQTDIAFELYLKPAIAECEKRGFTEPLSLAVVYDSMVHGSFYRVARGVAADRSDQRAWFTAYVRRRDAWLASYPRLASTRYRTRFFLNQIALSNWDLRLPMSIHGVRLTAGTFAQFSAVEPTTATSPTRPAIDLQITSNASAQTTKAQPPDAHRGSMLEKLGETVASAAERFDQVDRVVETVTTRKDAAKSLWTTVLGTIWQAAWAIFAFLSGLPGEFWITVAVIAAVLMLAYLYRQITLGKIRESPPLRQG